MKILFLMLLGLNFANAEGDNAYKNMWGKPVTVTETSSLNSLLAKNDQWPTKTIAIEATVVKVCEKKGCWMELKAEPENVRVTFKDYGFFVPTSLVGQKVKVQGQLIEKTRSIKEQKHFAKDAGQDQKNIDQINQPKKAFEFIADGVALETPMKVVK